MYNNKIKIAALVSMTLMSSSIFAKKSTNTDVFTAPQPFVSDLGNVEISLQTVNNFNPTNAGGPATYKGKAILNVFVSNGALNPVSVSCTGTLTPRVCTGAGITDCIWTDQAETFVFDSLNPVTVSAVAKGSQASANFTPVPADTKTTTSLGWGLEVYNVAATPVVCVITDDTNATTLTKKLFVPVA